jgi:SurA N-terminal domain
MAKKKILPKIINPVKTIKEKKLMFPVNFRLSKFNIMLILTFLFIPLVILVFFINKKLYVASVNGKLISRYQYFSELEKKDGKTVLDDMVTKQIIYQEAKNQGIVVTASDINAEIKKVEESVVSQGSTLNDVLTYQGITYNQLVENIKIQKILELILKDQVTVTDSEAQTYYNENKSFYGKDQTFDQLKDSIKYQLYQEKLTTVYRTWINEKRSASKIVLYD